MGESLQQHNHSNNHQHHKNKDAELLKSLQDSPEFQNNINRLGEVYTQLFGTEYLGNYCCYTDEGQQCSDGSDLYTLIKYEGKDLIVKVGAGEFNTKVFTTGNIKELKGFYYSPIPLFVVDQCHSYLGDEKDTSLRKEKPREYLNAYATIIYPRHKEAYYRTEKDRNGKPIEYNHINIRQYDDVLAVGRLALLKKEFPNGEFDKVIYMLKRIKLMDFEEFYKQIWKGREYFSEDMKKLIGCLWHMGVNTCGCAVGDQDAFRSLYELVQSFDVYKGIFTKLDSNSKH